MFKFKTERSLYIFAGCVCIGLGFATTKAIGKITNKLAKENK